MFVAIGHELAFGLRRGEIAQARWDWWKAGPGYPVLSGEAQVKSGTGRLRVRALDPWFNLMRARIEAEGWRGEDADYIIPGADNYRNEDLFRGIGSWMRQLGWRTKKTNHALRAYAGSQVAMKYELYEAQAWLRHSTIEVTKDHYTQYVKDFKSDNPDDIEARWATFASATPLRVLPDVAVA